MALSPIRSRLALHKDWVSDLPLKFLWTVDFSSRVSGSTADLGNNISRVLEKYERRGSRFWKINSNQLKDQSDPAGIFGLLVAQTIAFPSESFSISTESAGDMGGYIQGYIGKERNAYGTQNKLDITFLETNVDIIDNFIKPWIIACSHRGLIEDGNTQEDIKCTITVDLFTRDKRSYNNSSTSLKPFKSELEPRKRIEFYNAVPYSVEGDSISYGDLTESDWKKTVAFAFSHYSVVTPDDWLSD